MAIAVPLSFAASDVIVLIFGQKYAPAGPIAAMMMWTLVPFGFGLVQAYVLLASGNERTDMWLNILALVCNAALAIVLTPSLGGLGASAAILISFGIFFVTQQIVIARRHLRLWKGIGFKLLFVLVANVVVTGLVVHVHVILGVVAGQIVFWSLVAWLDMLDLRSLWEKGQRILAQVRGVAPVQPVEAGDHP